MIYDLCDIVISRRVESAWLAHVSHTVSLLMEKYPGLQGSEVPDEQFRAAGPGKPGEIFVKVRSTVIRLAVPAQEWRFK